MYTGGKIKNCISATLTACVYGAKGKINTNFLVLPSYFPLVD